MSRLLHIETSTQACSVAVSEDGQTLFIKEDLDGPNHNVQLGVFVDEATCTPADVCGGEGWLIADWARLAFLALACVLCAAILFTKQKR